MAQTFIRGSQIRNQSVGITKLDTTIIGGDGKLLTSLLPAAVAGAMVYQDAYDASTTVVPSAASAANKGHYYIISVAGTINGDDYQVGDWIVSNGAAWGKIDNSEKTELASTTAYSNTTSGLTATTVQAAIDEVEARVQTAEGAIGTLASLTTTEKGSLVGAVNEVNSKIATAASSEWVVETLPEYVDPGTMVVLAGHYKPTHVEAAGSANDLRILSTAMVYLNGALQEPDSDYTVAEDPGTLHPGFIQFFTPPQADDKVRVAYFKR